MTIIKPIVALALLIPYICTLGAFTFEVNFLDGTEICYNGWMV